MTVAGVILAVLIGAGLVLAVLVRVGGVESHTISVRDLPNVAAPFGAEIVPLPHGEQEAA